MLNVQLMQKRVCVLEPFLSHLVFIWLKLFCQFFGLPRRHRGFLKLNFSPCDIELTAINPEKCCIRFWQDFPQFKHKINWSFNLLCHRIVSFHMLMVYLYLYMFKLGIVFCSIFLLFFPLPAEWLNYSFPDFLRVYFVFGSSQEVVTQQWSEVECCNHRRHFKVYFKI